MASQIVLEICVESVDLAVAAERGGAHRIEICSDLSSGGITPSAGLLEATRHHVGIPIHVLIRPRAGDFLYSDSEFEIMARDIRFAKHLHMDGIVLGVLDEHRSIDVLRTAQLVELARPLPVTFHRAFDLCQDQTSCLEAVVQTGAKRILTSGGHARASDDLASLARLVQAAGDRVVVMPCGGVDISNLAHILEQTAAREIHTSLGMSNAGAGASNQKSNHSSGLAEVLGTPNNNTPDFETRARALRELLVSIESCSRS